MNTETPMSWRLAALIVIAFASIAAMPSLSEQTRATLDRTLRARGVYIAEESAYKFVFPRTDVMVQVGRQQLSPARSPASWVTFSPSVHNEAMMNGELVLLEHEVNPVMTAALNAGLEVTGLGAALLFERPRLLTMNVSGEGTFQSLATALSKTFDEAGRVGSSNRGASNDGGPLRPVANNIDGTAMNSVLSMRGTVTDGIFRAAIGRIALANGTPVGREMGRSTSIVIFGTNDHAFAEADLIVSPDQLQRLLKALRAKEFTVTAIRNHTVAEHPESLFVRVWKEGAALELAKGLRFALDVEVGAVKLGSDPGSD
jgi:uncharacterized protein DUF1259